MEYNRERVIKDYSMFFGLKGWIELPSAEMEKAMSGAVLGRSEI